MGTLQTRPVPDTCQIAPAGTRADWHGIWHGTPGQTPNLTPVGPFTYGALMAGGIGNAQGVRDDLLMAYLSGEIDGDAWTAALDALADRERAVPDPAARAHAARARWARLLEHRARMRAKGIPADADRANMLGQADIARQASALGLDAVAQPERPADAAPTTGPDAPGPGDREPPPRPPARLDVATLTAAPHGPTFAAGTRAA